MEVTRKLDAKYRVSTGNWEIGEMAIYVKGNLEIRREVSRLY